MVYGNRLYGIGVDLLRRQQHAARLALLAIAAAESTELLRLVASLGYRQERICLGVDGGRAQRVAGACWADQRSLASAAFRLSGAHRTARRHSPLIQRKVGAAVVTATPLLYYTLDHATLGPWEGSNPTYGATTQISGFVVVAGTRTVLYVGRNGLGPYCYGNGTSNQSLAGTYGPDGAMLCYDPAGSDKGSHAYPYRYQVWAYDLNDFAAVKAGTKQPWEVVPYGVWPLNFPTPEGTVRLSGVAYDAQRQLLYISQRGADPDGYASRPIIHVFQLNSSPGAITSPTPITVSSVSLTADKTAPQVPGTPLTFTAQPAGGVAPYQYKWLISDGPTTTVAVNWTVNNRYTWTAGTANPKYVVSVWVRSAGNSADALEASASLPFAIGAAAANGPATSVALVANRVAPQPPFTAITWTATPVGGIAPLQYKWLVLNGSDDDRRGELVHDEFVRLDAVDGQRQLPRARLGQGREQHRGPTRSRG